MHVMSDNGQPNPKRRLPRLDISTGINHSPHVVILGAGASRACCPEGDINGLKLPVMNDFVKTVGVESIIRKCGHDPADNFEEVYSRIHEEGNTTVIDELDAAVRSYFSRLALPDQPTLYDYLVLGLRPKDLIVTFNWDPLLPQAYKRWRHLGQVLPQLAFLHGNVEIGVDRDKKASGFMSDGRYSGHTLEPTSLLYSVEHKDYNSDLFIAEQWRMTTDYLTESYYFTVYGYSAPTTDVEARELLLKAWRDNPTRELAEIGIVDIRDPAEVKASWSDFIVSTHSSVSKDYNPIMRHPRRSCEAFAFATLQGEPWREDPFPTECSLDDLQSWIEPLIEEEETGKLNGTPLH